MKATNRADRQPQTTAPDRITDPSDDPRKQVVGVILSDGTVYGVPDTDVDTPQRPWSKGRFSGPGWSIWWERRVTQARGGL